MATQDQTQAPAAESGRGEAAARRAAGRAPAEGARRHEALHALRRPPVLDLRRLPRPRASTSIDVRHESAAAFAAEGWAKVTREPGVCALTAGPGRHERHERDRLRAQEQLADGRARRPRAADALGPGLAAGDRPRAVRRAAHARARSTAIATAEIPELVDEALGGDAAPPTGPTFLDLPLDVVFMEADEPGAARRRCPTRPRCRAADGSAIERVGALLGGAERPVIMAGTDLYWGHGEEALRELSEALGIPVFLNGLARGCLPADHPNFFSRARGAALKGADVALVIGVPMDFRLGFGGIVRRGDRDRADRRRRARARAAARARRRALRRPAGDARRRCARRRSTAGGSPEPDRGVARLAARDRGREARRASEAELERRPRAAASAARLQGARARCSTATRS